MTQKLYEKDSYCKSFSAKVINCTEKDGFYYVELDQTAFFPEGGGQAPDQGFLEKTEVLDVQIEDGVILHKVRESFTTGTEVVGKIDWELRFSRMQSHAGEHIVSGVVHSLFGYDNAGFHMGEATMTVDFSGPLSKEDILQVELEANKAIYRNVRIYATYPSKEDLSKINYRSKIDPRDDMRLINIEGVDCCACCAPHPSYTGEIGLVKIVDFMPHRGGTRVTIVAGINAFKDYSFIHDSNKQLMGMLSASRDNVVVAVERQMTLVGYIKAENQTLSQELALCKLKPVMVNGSAYNIFQGLTYDDLRCCANSLTDTGVETCVLFSEKEVGQYIYVVSGLGDRVDSIVKALNSGLNGKGGGRNGYAQGRVSDTSEEFIVKFIEELL